MTFSIKWKCTCRFVNKLDLANENDHLFVSKETFKFDVPFVECWAPGECSIKTRRSNIENNVITKMNDKFQCWVNENLDKRFKRVYAGIGKYNWGTTEVGTTKYTLLAVGHPAYVVLEGRDYSTYLVIEEAIEKSKRIFTVELDNAEMILV